MLRIGTDCSGMEAPIEAFKQLGKNIKHVFSSDVDKYCIETIKANCNPDIFFSDITIRHINNVPDIDMYICGFPCQPFSYSGTRRGFDDRRGNIFWSCYDVIKFKLPKVFVLENVPGLLTQNNGDAFNIIYNSLKDIGYYNIYHKVLNTMDYGIPQHRKRLYIIGIKKDIQITQFDFPSPIKMEKLSKFIDKKDKTKNIPCNSVVESGLFERIPKDSLFIDFNFRQTNFTNSNKVAPCIMASTQSWCVPKHRYANIKELLSLQGFSTDYKQVVSKTQFKKQIGNSMSVNVIKELLQKIFIATNL